MVVPSWPIRLDPSRVGKLMPSTSISAVYGSPTMWYLRMSPSKGEASNSSAVRPRAESAALKASSVGAKADTLAEVSSKAFSKPAALMAAAKVVWSGLLLAASTSPVVTSGLMQSGLPWLKSEAPAPSPAPASSPPSAEGTTTTTLLSVVSSIMSSSGSDGIVTGASSAGSDGIVTGESPAGSDGIVTGAPSAGSEGIVTGMSCRRLLLPPPLRASMADWGSITASMTCTMPWQVYTSLCAMVALPLAATMVVP